ncbi:Ubiquitin--protein ligase [Bertholletia excelsa]
MAVPHHFLCPISMQLMRDPVTVSTGIACDRHSIETWPFSYRKRICRVTKQPLSIADPTPNHTLRRLIQAWCTLNASSEGIEQLPTPNPAIDSTQIAKLLNDAKKSPHSQKKCLQILSSIACSADERSKMCLEVAGAVETLFHLQFSEEGLKKLNNDGEFVQSIMLVLKCNNSQSRAYAVMINKSIFEAADPIHFINVRPELFDEIGEVLKDKISQQASKAALRLLVEFLIHSLYLDQIILWAFSISIFSESSLLPLYFFGELDRSWCSYGDGQASSDTHERRTSELVLGVLQKLCTCAKGVLSKLCLVHQVETIAKTSDRTKEILKIHSRVRMNFSCILPNLLACYLSVGYTGM